MSTIEVQTTITLNTEETRAMRRIIEIARNGLMSTNSYDEKVETQKALCEKLARELSTS